MSIKNIIEYYYNIKNITLHRNHKEYRFTYYNNEYLFLPTTRYENELIEINNLIKEFSNYDQIITNVDNKLITFVNNHYYVLIKKSSSKLSVYDSIRQPLTVFLPPSAYESIDRSNWLFLWSEKIDYIEYQQMHLNKYPILRDSVNYFIGMAETAISYIYNTYNNFKMPNFDLVISHKRIKEKGFNNPLNLIVDNKSRDIAEYLKFIFFNNNYDYSKLNDFLRSLDFNQFSYQLIYGRMLFPTYYFDIYDEIINKNTDEKVILKIIKRVEEYENYVINIYSLINQIKAIEKVNWL